MRQLSRPAAANEAVATADLDALAFRLDPAEVSLVERIATGMRWASSITSTISVPAR